MLLMTESFGSKMIFVTTNPCLTWVITHTNDPSLTNMNTYKCKKRKKSKVYICDLQNHIRVMFDWYSLSSLHWGLKRKDIGVKWCLRTALYLCASSIYIFQPDHILSFWPLTSSGGTSRYFSFERFCASPFSERPQKNS